MKKKINLDRDPISREEIASRMNFDQLLSNFPGYNPPFYKSGWFITTVASVAVLATVTTTLLLNNNKEVTESQKEIISFAPPTKKQETFSYDEDTPCINPPVKELDIQADTYLCNNETGGEFKHSTGSIISIPKNSFVDQNGNRLNGNIEIRYREFHDPIDFIVSGIPMTYDSAGTEYTFESAGMVEVYGYQNGQPVEIAEGKSIHIEMDPKDGSSRFNLYELDTTTGDWTYKGKTELIEEKIDESTGETTPNVSVIIADKLDQENNIVTEAKKEYVTTKIELKKASKDVIEHIKTEPVQPKTSVNKDRQFELDVNPNEFPELKNYSQLKFEVDKNDKNFSTDVYSIEWEDISLSEKEKGKSYYLTLFKSGSKKTFSVHPIFKGEDYKKAMAEFNHKFETYTKELDKRKAKEEVLKEKLKKQMASYEKALAEEKKRKEEASIRNAKFIAAQKEIQKNTAGIQVVARAFNVTQFGTWNCDSPIAQPSGQKVEASFASNIGENLGLHNVNLIEKNKNAVFTYNENQFKKFKFNPKEKNTIIAFTSDNSIAIIRNEYFIDLPKGKKHQFKMEILDIKSLTLANIKETLNL